MFEVSETYKTQRSKLQGVKSLINSICLFSSSQIYSYMRLPNEASQQGASFALISYE